MVTCCVAAYIRVHSTTSQQAVPKCVCLAQPLATDHELTSCYPWSSHNGVVKSQDNKHKLLTCIVARTWLRLLRPATGRAVECFSCSPTCATQTGALYEIVAVVFCVKCQVELWQVLPLVDCITAQHVLMHSSTAGAQEQQQQQQRPLPSARSSSNPGSAAAAAAAAAAAGNTASQQPQEWLQQVLSQQQGSAPAPHPAGPVMQTVLRTEAQGTLAAHQAKIAEIRTAMWVYLTPVLGFLYLLSPLDIIPDFLPLIGWLDDLLVLVYVACSMYSMLGRQQQQDRNRMTL
ncbi:hypothetical protein COO60DRAFT_335491 [Scenedesmus sp. NREL 46B-D3]|nr:hypothetical protein COO60DRAFT_335491 [Scenedesmus sp. NREL 46B-D3]